MIVSTNVGSLSRSLVFDRTHQSDVGVFDISIRHIKSILFMIDISTLFKNIDVNKVIFENINVNIDKELPKYINIEFDKKISIIPFSIVLIVSISISIGM